MSTKEQDMPRTKVTLAPLGLDTVEGCRKANEEEEAADGCFTWPGQVRMRGFKRDLPNAWTTSSWPT